MTSSAPQQLEGTHSPNSLEAFWDRNRGAVKTAFWIMVLCLAGYYGWQYYLQQEKNAKWSAFASNVLLGDLYSPEEEDLSRDPTDLLFRWSETIKAASIPELESRLATAEKVERPYLLWLIAARSFDGGDFSTAKSYGERLLAEFPSHPLCVETEFPVQFRHTKPKDKDKDKTEEEPKPVDMQDHDQLYEAAVAGSTVGRLLQGIERAAAFQLPTDWQKPEIPADAPRYKIVLSDGEGLGGEFTIALMTAQAAKHCEAFEKLAEAKHWDGLRIDAINRPSNDPTASRYQRNGRQFHFGFESTRDQPDRTEWDTTTPSDEEHVVEGEFADLSNFPGAVAARSAQGKSEMDRLWICGDDRVDQDGARQVFAYVVEGMEVVEDICDTDFEKSEDEVSGRGKPATNITIESVTKVE